MNRALPISSRDLVIIGLLLIIIVGAWLRIDSETKTQKESGAVMGKILRIDGGTGKHLKASDFFWSEVEKGQEIGTNDSFMTGPDTTAEIEIGKSRIVLRPNTLIKFVKEDLVKFNDGQIIVTGEDLKVKTISAVHKVSGEVVITTVDEKDKVSVTTGEHTILPEESIQEEPATAEVAPAPEEVLPTPPQQRDFFMSKEWMDKQDLPRSIFAGGETLEIQDWIQKTVSTEKREETVFIEGKETKVTYYLPLLGFSREFEVSDSNVLSNKRRLNATLIVNGQSFEASEQNKIKLRPKSNAITLTHRFQSKDYTFYVDEEADDIKIRRTEYELTTLSVSETEPQLLIAESSQTEEAEEEEEEEPQGRIRLEWEGKLKDNQIFIVRIKRDEDLILEDFSEENNYSWTPPASGEYRLEISIKSTVTERILKTRTSSIHIKRTPTQEIPAQTPETSEWKFQVAMGPSYLNSSSKNTSEEVNVNGFSPLGLRLAINRNETEVMYESRIYYADIPSADEDKFLNHRILIGHLWNGFIPSLGYQAMKLIYSENEELKLKASNVGLIGLGYRLSLPGDLRLIPTYHANIGEFSGYQLALEAKYNLTFYPELELTLRGERNVFEEDNFKSSSSQLSLLFGLIF